MEVNNGGGNNIERDEWITDEIHNIINKKLTDLKSKLGLSEGCGFRDPTLWCGYDGLCDECKQKQEKKEDEM